MSFRLFWKPSALGILAAGSLFLPWSSLRADFFETLKSHRVDSSPQVTWQHFGPGMSGYIDKFWIHPTDSNAMFMSLDMGQTHATWNRGESWHSIRDFDGTGKDFEGVTGIEFSHQDPDFGLMMSKEGIYKTADRGRTWTFVLDIDETNSEKHSHIAVDPNNDDNWYIGAGQHWMIKQTHFNKDGLIYTDDQNHSEGFILKSTDRGGSWSKITSVFPADSDFSKIIVDPRDSTVVYASCNHGLYKSTDSGINWVKVPGNGLPHNQPRDIAGYYDSETGEFLLFLLEVTHYEPDGDTISTTGGVFRSSDGGTNWDDLTGNLKIDLNKISMDGYISKYYRAIAFWLKITESQAKSLYPNLPTETFSQFIRIAVDPTNKDRIYLVHNFKHDYSFPPGNIWMTEDGGVNWIAVAREGLYWINERDKAYWQGRGNPLGMNAHFAHVQKEHAEQDNTQTGPRYVFTNLDGEVFTCFDQQTMVSKDHGVTWNQADDIETSPGSGHWVGRGDSNLPGETICVETGTPGTYLFGSGEHGLWRNTGDGDLVYPGAIAVEQLTGQSKGLWDTLSIATIAVHPDDPDKIYTLQFRQNKKGELRYSPDGGGSWSTLSKPIEFPGTNDVIDQRSLLIDPVNPQNMYFCVPLSEIEYWASGQWFPNGPDGFTGHGIYKSTDGGYHWSRSDDGIASDKSVYRMTINADNPQILYAALNKTHEGVDGGLYRTTDGGVRWSPMNIPNGVICVNQVVYERMSGRLFIACGSYASDGSVGGVWVSADGGDTWEKIFDMPNVHHVAPSPVDPDVIAVSVGQAQEIGFLNPGAYVTLDGAKTWHKINRAHGQPGRIRCLRADPHDRDVLWCSLNGTGFFRADLSGLRFPLDVRRFAATDDADVKASAPDQAFGTNTNLKMEPWSPRHVYFKFNVVGVTAAISSARLWVRNHRDQPLDGILTAYASENGWDEDDVTWNTRAPMGAKISQRVMGVADEWYDIDVTSYVTDNGIYSIAVKPSALGYLYAREYGDGGNAAYLEIASLSPEALFEIWMEKHGMTDPLDDEDRDGVDNRTEYVHDTDPNDPASKQVFFGGMNPETNGRFVISFSSSASRLYQVETAAVLEGDWQPFSDEFSGTGEVMEVSDTIGTESRFYRLRTSLK